MKISKHRCWDENNSCKFFFTAFFVLEGGYGAFEGTCKRKHTKKSDYDELVEFIMDGDKSRKITIVNIIYFEND